MVDVASRFTLGGESIHSLQSGLIAGVSNSAMANRPQQAPIRKPAAPQSHLPSARMLPGQTNRDSSFTFSPYLQSDGQAGGQVPHAAQGLALQHNTTYAPAPSYQAQTVGNNWVPEEGNIQRVDGSYDSSYTTASWQHPSFIVATQAESLAPNFQSLPQGSVTPAINIPQGFSNFETVPQSQAFRSQAGFLSPHYNNMATYEQTQATEMPSPVSPHSPRHSRAVTPVGEQIGRKRAFSEMSQPHFEPEMSSSGMVFEGPKLTQKVSRTMKRSDAPMNPQGKYVCDASPDCATLTFDRKCEWSKHMDKHDRPYRCPHPACAKLQGFTYSGGLLRHEREVHGKHGGPKAFLMCPHLNCKRHSEKGFTRKENLQEHLRRVHSGKDDGALNVDHGAELSTPASGLSGGPDVDEMYGAALTTKRQRSYDPELDNPARGRVDELEQQLSVLRQENADKTMLIERLQVEAQAQNARLASLENTIQQLQSGS